MASMTVPRKPRSSSTRTPAMVLPPGEQTASFRVWGGCLVTSAISAARVLELHNITAKILCFIWNKDIDFYLEYR